MIENEEGFQFKKPKFKLDSIRLLEIIGEFVEYNKDKNIIPYALTKFIERKHKDLHCPRQPTVQNHLNILERDGYLNVYPKYKMKYVRKNYYLTNKAIEVLVNDIKNKKIETRPNIICNVTFEFIQKSNNKVIKEIRDYYSSEHVQQGIIIKIKNMTYKTYHPIKVDEGTGFLGKGLTETQIYVAAINFINKLMIKRYGEGLYKSCSEYDRLQRRVFRNIRGIKKELIEIFNKY